jgi:hypothetical protein
VEDNGAVEGGLALSTDKAMTVGRKSNISKAKSIASKEVLEGKQMTFNGVLREGKNPRKVTS